MTRCERCWLDWHRRGLRRVCGSPVGRWSLWAASQASRPCGIHGEDGWEASAGSRRRRTPASQPRAATLPSSDGSAKGLHSSVRAEVLVSCRALSPRPGGRRKSFFHPPGFQPRGACFRWAFPEKTDIYPCRIQPGFCGFGVRPEPDSVPADSEARMSGNLHDLLAGRFPADRRRPCFILSDGSEISYGALEDSAGRVAARLVAEGVRPGDRVALQAEKSAEAIMIYLGVLKAGAVFVPLNAAYTQAEIDYFLVDAEPRVFVTDPPGFVREAAGYEPLARERAARGRRSRLADLHQRHHRPLQGRDAEPSQPGRERAGAACGVGFHGEGCAAARPAGLPCARPVRGAALCAAVRRADGLAAEVQRRARCWPA